MRYIHGILTIVEVSFKKKIVSCTFILSLVLLNVHLVNALPTSTGCYNVGTAISALHPPSKTSTNTPISIIADLLDRSVSDATTAALDRPTLTVDVVNVSVVNIGGTIVAEDNGALLSSNFIPPAAPSLTRQNGLDIVFSVGPAASKITASTATLIVTFTMPAPAAIPSGTMEAVMEAVRTSTKSTPRGGHIIFECIALVAISILMGMLTSRIIAIYPHRHRVLASEEHALRWLVLLIPILGLFFITSSVMLIDIWDDNSTFRCHAATILCLVFYIGVKVLEYLFLIERAHQLRSKQSFNHLADSWFLIEFLALIIGFGVTAFFGFHEPEAYISVTDGLCRIGLPPRIAITILAFNVVLSIDLAVHFCVLAWNVSPTKSVQQVFGYLYTASPFKKLQAASDERQKLRAFRIGRVVWGLVAITIPMFANLFILAYVHGHEQGWLCFSVCTVDITWGIIVIHWLTSEPSYSDPPVPPLPSPAVRLRSHFRGRPRVA